MAPMRLPNDVHLELGGPHHKVPLFNLEKDEKQNALHWGEGLVIVREDCCYTLSSLR